MSPTTRLTWLNLALAICLLLRLAVGMARACEAQVKGSWWTAAEFGASFTLPGRDRCLDSRR